jgi:hypothetical protein
MCTQRKFLFRPKKFLMSKCKAHRRTCTCRRALYSFIILIEPRTSEEPCTKHRKRMNEFEANYHSSSSLTSVGRFSLFLWWESIGSGSYVMLWEHGWFSNIYIFVLVRIDHGINIFDFIVLIQLLLDSLDFQIRFSQPGYYIFYKLKFNLIIN